MGNAAAEKDELTWLEPDPVQEQRDHRANITGVGLRELADCREGCAEDGLV